MTPRPFNPDTAPKVRLTGEDRSAISADMNKVALKLHEAGIQLYGFYKIHDLVRYWNPLGFDFMCDNWQQLLNAADRAPRMGFDLIVAPNSPQPLRPLGKPSAPSSSRNSTGSAATCISFPV